jgi:hypothetical protein
MLLYRGKGGFETAIRILPYIVGMLVAISMLRTSGTFDVIINGMKTLFAALGTDTRFVDGLPTALIKPLSGSGARNDDRHYVNIWTRFFCGAIGLYTPGLFRYHILCDRSLFWIGKY